MEIINDHELSRLYANNVCVPSSLVLYKVIINYFFKQVLNFLRCTDFFLQNAACLRMPLAELGTLIDAINVLHHKNIFFSVREHEFICAYFTYQVFIALNKISFLYILINQRINRFKYYQMLGVLRALHATKIVHSDVKVKYELDFFDNKFEIALIFKKYNIMIFRPTIGLSLCCLLNLNAMVNILLA